MPQKQAAGGGLFSYKRAEPLFIRCIASYELETSNKAGCEYPHDKRRIMRNMKTLSISQTKHYLKQLPLNFCKCGVTGWCLEVLFTSTESIMRQDWRLMGRTSLLMFPIYGCGALLGPIGNAVDNWLNPRSRFTIKRTDLAIRHGMLYMVLIFVAEYASGAWLKARGMCPWDYTGRSTNIDGLIRLNFAPLWFATGLLFEQITKKKGG